MQYQLVLQPEAIEEIDLAYAWYEQQKAHLGRSFLDELEVTLDKIVRNPRQYGFANKWVRKLKLRKFPFLVVFEIEGDKIYVYSVLHTSKQPKY